ncbi:MAG TPA: glycosyltransferase family 4 protein [Bdellovibrionota bacterium]|nr:glycosyltransferase family 4 protein [Bdellovibrionota bacterium]
MDSGTTFALGSGSASTALRAAETDRLTALLKGRLDALVICLSHSWGGLEQVAANDSLELGRIGLKARVLCLQGSPIHEHLAHRSEVELVPIDFRPRDHFDLGMRRELKRLRADGVNLIHTHQTSILGSIVPWFYRDRRLTLLASRHIMNDHSKRTPWHLLLYRRLDALVVMSRALRRNVIATHPLRERQVKVIHLGLDFDLFDPEKVNPQRQRAEWGADENTIVIGMVGRIDPAKGQATFIKAAAGIMKRLREGEKVKFVIVGEETLGSTSNYVEELREVVSQFRIGAHVVFAGYQENIPEVMRALDIFVMPSRQEAFGLVAIEAMAMECPIVISRGGSADEIVGEQEFGLLVRPEDAFDLQRQLRYLLDNPMERVRMGQAAREHVSHNYDRRVRLQRTLSLYERFLRQKEKWEDGSR